MTAELLRSGAPIHEINAKRRELSAVKGGKLVKNPFTGEMVTQKPRPASRSVRVRPMKAMKDML